MMKKHFALIVFLLAGFAYGQQVMMMFDIEAESPSSFKAAADNWMKAVEKTVGDTPDMYTYRVAGSRDMRMLQWFNSKQDMVAHMDKMDANESKVEETLSGMEPMPDEVFQKFVSGTKFREASVWEHIPELSTMDGWSALSDEEKLALTYRRVQYFSVDFGQDDAFEAWRKKVNAIDKELGINFHMVIYRSVFGAKDKDYMVILIDKTRFDYHKNWAERMAKRQASEAFQSMVNNNETGWTAIGEENWRRINDMTY